MTNEVDQMAREFYGYGRWDASYWFIGPEQGGDNNEVRAKAYLKLAKDGLCDCREFHQEIREFQLHRESPALVPTWRRLILLLKTFLHEFTDDELLNRERVRKSIRDYQRDLWGMRNGETCVIELSGLSAKNSRVGEGYRTVKEKYLEERIRNIISKIHMGEVRPRFVVMYGFSEREHWGRIAGIPFVAHGVTRKGSTVFAFPQHPSAQKQEDSYWIDFGHRLRNAGGQGNAGFLNRPT